jgi:two-component system chemotaxis sensor kinase CheA
MKPSKQDFVDEAEEIIEKISAQIVELNDEVDPDTLNSVFRGVHTLKGLSGLFGLKNLTNLCHALESLLDDLRLGEINMKEDTADFILTNIDIIKGQVIQVADDKDIGELTGPIKDIEDFRKSNRHEEAEDPLAQYGISPSILKVLSQYEETRLKSNLKEGNDVYMINTVFTLEEFAPKLEELNAALKDLGEIIATLPNSENVPDGSIGFKLFYGTTLTIDDLKEKISIENIEQLTTQKTPDSTKSVSNIAKAEDGSLGATHTVRVNIDKLDKILNTVGELIMAKGAVSRITNELTESMGYVALTNDMHNVSDTLDKSLKGLQNYILELRMVPFSQIFAKLAQVVRRHTREVKKNIDLKLFGEDTEVDKQIAEDIMDPLIHLIRNSIDHGIELADKRASLGKSEQGIIIMKAFSTGNNIVIEIQDDGAGLDTDRILEKAISKGLVNEDHSLDEKDIYNLIFLPGLSTKDTVSELSGRGVGMDIVKDKIVSLGGLVDIETEKNVGTKFILTLPITLAIVKALIIQVADTVFAIPLTSISETFVIDTKKIQTIEGREVIELRDEILPLLRLANIFELEEVRKDHYFGVVVGIGNRRLGLLVDSLLQQTDIIIKPLGDRLKEIPGISGAAEIGRHNIVFVVDIEAMMEELFMLKKTRVRVD